MPSDIILQLTIALGLGLLVGVQREHAESGLAHHRADRRARPWRRRPVQSSRGGLPDVDAITLSTARLAQQGLVESGAASRTILIAVLANLSFKGAVVVTLGSRELTRKPRAGAERHSAEADCSIGAPRPCVGVFHLARPMLHGHAEEGNEVLSNESRDWTDKVRDEVASLRTLRDELRVRIHLGTKDAKDRWDETERAWHELERLLEKLGRATVESSGEVGAAVRLLGATLIEAYRHIHSALESGRRERGRGEVRT